MHLNTHSLSLGKLNTFLTIFQKKTKTYRSRISNVIERFNFGLADLESVAVFDLPSPSMSS